MVPVTETQTITARGVVTLTKQRCIEQGKVSAGEMLQAQILWDVEHSNLTIIDHI